MIKKIHKKAERGQAIILIAVAFVGMIALVGLMTDGGMLLIEYARLKRGIDAASIASAAQFRKNIDTSDIVIAELETAAREFLSLNQSDADQVVIDTCLKTESYPTDPLCELPVRKLVRVTATRHITFGFLKVIGINGTDITATSVGEAASIDMVLVIDTSASMAFETATLTTPEGRVPNPNKNDPASYSDPVGYPGDNPEVCNANMDNAKRCEPLGTIKDVAAQFVGKLFFPYDRVSIVTLTEQTPGIATRKTFEVLPLTDDLDVVTAAIQGLKVFQPARCWLPADGAVCLNFDDHPYDEPYDTLPIGEDVFLGSDSQHYRDVLAANTPDPDPDLTDNFGDPSLITSSNIGGGLFMAGYEFTAEPMRQDSFWVVITLIGGPANATNRAGDIPPDSTFPANGFCPESTWVITEPSPGVRLSNFCRDADSASRHNIGPGPLFLAPANYDADDFARDGADFVADPINGQGATIFSICVGYYCQNYPSTDPASAENLAKYMALEAGDDIASGTIANHGLYFYSADPAGLEDVFDAIADKIFTRISQ